MAGKRIYITVPKRDFDLIRRLALLTGQCPGMWARTQVLVSLYAVLQTDQDLQDYDAVLARVERAEVLNGR